ncbi:MAG: VanZ family protein [Lachnospiraceae bacterium]|nr:VanZ family protein [Lachnospiraceae bacterium]
MSMLWKRLLTGILLVAWMAVIFWFSAQPAEASGEISGTITYRLVSTTGQILHMELSESQVLEYTEKLEHPIRKAAHMTEYAILGLLSVFFCRTFSNRMRRIYPIAFLMAFCYACTDEFHQLFVPGRAGRFTDVCIDTAGACIALILLYLMEKRRKAQK